jgi:hypothetical protein
VALRQMEPTRERAALAAAAVSGNDSIHD